jgi:hypothetical protein
MGLAGSDIITIDPLAHALDDTRLSPLSPCTFTHPTNQPTNQPTDSNPKPKNRRARTSSRGRSRGSTGRSRTTWLCRSKTSRAAARFGACLLFCVCMYVCINMCVLCPTVCSGSRRRGKRLACASNPFHLVNQPIPQSPKPKHRDKLVAVQGRYHSDYRAFEAIEGVFEGAGGAAAAAG